MHCKRQARLRNWGNIQGMVIYVFFLKTFSFSATFNILCYHAFSFLPLQVVVRPPHTRSLQASKTITVLVIWFTGCPKNQHDLGRDFDCWRAVGEMRQKEERSLINWFYLLLKKAWWNDLGNLPKVALNLEHCLIKPVLRCHTCLVKHPKHISVC